MQHYWQTASYNQPTSNHTKRTSKGINRQRRHREPTRKVERSMTSLRSNSSPNMSNHRSSIHKHKRCHHSTNRRIRVRTKSWEEFCLLLRFATCPVVDDAPFDMIVRLSHVIRKEKW